MRKKRLSGFSLVEILVVVAIISILIGLSFPSLSRSKEKTKAVRWLAFNALANRDGDTVVNYNFMYQDYELRSGDVSYPAIRNGSIGCTLSGFMPVDYDGVIGGAYEWRVGGGRWIGFNNALQFDGSSTFVVVSGQVLSFDPLVDDFTALAWVRLDNTSAPMTIFSKTNYPGAAQYELTVSSTGVNATVGGVAKSWPYQIQANLWTHLALVSKKGAVSLFINGKNLNTVASASLEGIRRLYSANASIAPVAFLNVPILLAASTNANPTPGNNTPGNNTPGNNTPGNNTPGNNTPGNNNPSNNTPGSVTPPSGATTKGRGYAYGLTKKANGSSSNALILGASGLATGETSLNFAGRMDEFILMRKALSPSEIYGCWSMGNPY